MGCLPNCCPEVTEGCVEPPCPEGGCSDCSPDVQDWIVNISAVQTTSGVFGSDDNRQPVGPFGWACLKPQGGGIYRTDPITMDMRAVVFPTLNNEFGVGEFGEPLFLYRGLGIVDLVFQLSVSGGGCTLQELAYVQGTTTFIAVIGTWVTVFPVVLGHCADDANGFSGSTGIQGPGTAFQLLRLDPKYDPINYRTACTLILTKGCCFPLLPSSCADERDQTPSGSPFFTDCGTPDKCLGSPWLPRYDGDPPDPRQLFITLHGSGGCGPLDGLVIPVNPCPVDNRFGVQINPIILGPGPLQGGCNSGDVATVVSGISISVDYTPNLVNSGPCIGTCTKLVVTIALTAGCRNELTLNVSLSWQQDPINGTGCSDILEQMMNASDNVVCGDANFYLVAGQCVADRDTQACNPAFARFTNIPLIPFPSQGITSSCGSLSATLSE